MTRLPLVVLLAAGACGPLPRDADGTSARIAADGRMTVAIVSADPTSDARVHQLVASVARTLGARPVERRFTGEAALLAIEEGKLDLLVAPTDADSPWRTRVAMSPPVAEGGGWSMVPITRNGENRLADIVHRAAIQVRAQ